jgi:hypothetical protein
MFTLFSNSYKTRFNAEAELGSTINFSNSDLKRMNSDTYALERAFYVYFSHTKKFTFKRLRKRWDHFGDSTAYEQYYSLWLSSNSPLVSRVP